MSDKKWKRKMAMSDDNRQTRLGASEPIKLEEPYKAETIFTQDLNQIVFCPFCLYYCKLQAFLVSTKKGYSYSNANCPECKQGMRMSTLVADMNPEQFAEFVHPYAGSGFWKKVNFAQWNERLRKMGWSYRFWQRYKELKSEGSEEAYEAYIERKQREEHEAGEY